MKPFTTTLAELRGGAANEEMSEAMSEVVEQVRLTGRAGTITMKIRVEPASEGDVDRLKVSDEITVKAPKVAKKATFFFADPKNNLSRNDPLQQHIPEVREVADEKREVRDV